MKWNNIHAITAYKFTCGYCGQVVASDKGCTPETNKTSPSPHAPLSPYIYWKIVVCPHCDKPSFFTKDSQIPGVSIGVEVKNLPTEVESLYREARNTVSVGAYTSSVLACRKLLMNIAVAQGAEEGKTFVFYVDYLANAGYIPPNGRGWVDHIRKKGNEATHEIVVKSQSDAEELITFSEMLLKFIYEFPSRVPQPSAPTTP